MQAGSQAVKDPLGQNNAPPCAARRTTAAALKQQILGFLAEALPAGWAVQPLERAQTAAADILIVSPRGRCHFLFVLAPADRWWDGGPHSVPAEGFSAAEARLARRLRAAGHRARAVWTAKDLDRALRAWACPLAGPVRLGRDPQKDLPPREKPARPTLHLTGWGRGGHG